MLSMCNDVNQIYAFKVSWILCDPTSVKAAFEKIKEQAGDAHLAAAVYNVGAGYVKKPFLELTLKEYTGGFESNAVGFFNLAQATLPSLLAAVPSSLYPPTILVTGATAALRGVTQNAPFASGKCSLRVTAQSLAKEFGPQGVHISHLIVDGGIDTPWGKDRVSNEGKEDGKIKPAAIADAYWWLHTQPRSSFTFEIDIRSFIEKW